MMESTRSFSRRLTTENTALDKVEVKAASSYIFFPWTNGYKSWWTFTVFAAAFTAFLETYQIAFSVGWNPKSGSAIIDYILLIVFLADMIVNFNLAYYNESSKLIFVRRDIARNYFKGWFWIDFLGLFPFYIVGWMIAMKMGAVHSSTEPVELAYLRLFKLFRLLRLHRVITFFQIIKYSRKISLVSYTLMRNFSAAVFWCHLWACIMYFIARQHSFHEENTWIGSMHADMTAFDRYILSLYWSVVTFSTTGYGDWHPVNSTEQLFCIIYLMLSVVIMAWIIGSMTLLIVKNDQKTSLYRDTLRVLYTYSNLHQFDAHLTKQLKTQLKLSFKNKDLTDEQVLHFFPSTVKQKILRRLYMPSLLSTELMQDTRQHFVDSFLSLCSVETFSPGVDLLHQGTISPDLYLLVDGVVGIPESVNNGFIGDENNTDETASSHSSDNVSGMRLQQTSGFINELGFFTESPEGNTIRTQTTCKVLVMRRAHYKEISAEDPESAGVVLRNLLAKLGDRRRGFSKLTSSPLKVGMQQKSSMSVVGSTPADAVRELVDMHIKKQKDEHTYLMFFAASRGDVATVARMCNQGFDPDSLDYDKRSALMVAAMNGKDAVVAKLLEYGANPNLIDVHGYSSLYIATMKNHENIIALLITHEAELSLSEILSASTLCRIVHDGDNALLQRFIKAKIQVNAADYDKRTAAHIAASEGNLTALKLLVETGADLSLKDRWGNGVRSEAEMSKSGKVLEYLDSLDVLM